jgi:hypothetical protein
MDAIKSILVKEIEQINRREGRDGKPRFNSEFARTHRYLCLAMFAGYFAVIAVKHIDARPFGQRRQAGAQVLRVLVNVEFRLEAVWHHGGGVILLMNEYWFFSQYSVPRSRLHTRRIITHRDL